MAGSGDVKDLYMATSMEELNKKMSTANIDCSTPKLLGRSSNTLFLAAKDAALLKDEEKAYVLFMRFMELVKRIRSSKEYKSRKAEYDKMVPMQKIKTALSEAERLSGSLKERYSTPQEKRQKLDSEQAQASAMTDQEVPNVATDTNKPLSAEELYKRNSSTALVPQQPVISNKSTESDTTSTISITAQDLFALLKSAPDDVIILDCRPRSMFLSSHPDGKKYPQWLSVPEEMIKNGITCDSISKFLRGNGRKMWEKRVSKEAIVLVDCATTATEFSASELTGLPLSQLRDVIHKYDTAVELPRPPLILEGGYTKWYLHYSPVCVGVWKSEGGRERGGGGETGGSDGEGVMEGSGSSMDYPTFPEISLFSEEADVSTDHVQEDQTTPVLPPVTTEEAAQNPDTQFSQSQTTQVVPSAPVTLPTPHLPTNHTPFPQPPLQTVPVPMYEPPPVMTILSLDDPNLNQDDPTFQLSTLPDNRVNHFGDDPVYQSSTHIQLQGRQQIVQPNIQSAQPHFVSEQNVMPQVQMNQQQPQFEQSYWQMGQVHSQNEQPTQLHPQSGQVYHQNEQITYVHPQSEQLYLSNGQPHIVGPQNAQILPPNGQPAQFVNSPTEQVVHTTIPQLGHPGHPDHRSVHTGIHHQQTVQPAPQVEQPVVTNQPSTHMQPTPSQAIPDSMQRLDTVPNQRVAYGSVPYPPGYEQAVHLPTQHPVQPPIPPPVLVPNQSHSQTGQPENQPIQFHNHQQHVQYSNQAGPISNSADNYVMGQPHPNPPQYQGGVYQNQVEPVQNQIQKPVNPVHTQQPPPQNAQVHIDPNAAKIQELEHQLQMKEERERAWQEKEDLEKAALEQEKQKWREDTLREREKLEQAKLVLAQEKAVLIKSKEELDRMRLQVEEERRKSETESEQLRQLLKVQQSGQKNQRTFAVNQGLPAGWEKKLDRTTGRFYYVDHHSKSTHWNPPSSWLDYQAQLQQRMVEKQVAQKPGVPGQISEQSPHYHGGPSQISQLPPQQQANTGRVVRPDVHPTQGALAQISDGPPPLKKQPTHSTTVHPGHLSQPQMGQPIAKQATPSVDRSNKPQAPTPASTPTVDRSTKPTMSAAMHTRKVNALQPIHGSLGYGLTGLRNLGNTCFMNSTLQCLCATSSFVTHFLSGSYLKDHNRSNPLGHGGVLADEFSFLMKSMWSGQYRYISPRDFKDTISQFAPTFSGTQQHDSQEFLAFLLDGLHEDMNRVKERRYIQNPDYSRYDDREAANVAWTLHKKRNDSIIVDLFQGQFRSTLRCLTCKHRSVNFEAFMYLSVPLPPGNSQCSVQMKANCSLLVPLKVELPLSLSGWSLMEDVRTRSDKRDCIKLFTREERVSGDDKWYCSSCKQHRDASKCIEIWKLPAVLLIHLKRFSYDGVWREKKQNFVDFPFGDLDMTSYVVGQRDNLQKYKLFGVSNHFGSLTGGHYTAYCLNTYKQRFYNFDDREIKDISQRQVKSAAAYLLFYTSMDLSPPKVF